MLGKFGPPIGPGFREALNQQVAKSIKTYVFLTTREGWGGPYVTDRCPLRQVHKQLEADQRALVPPYYATSAPNIKTWF